MCPLLNATPMYIGGKGCLLVLAYDMRRRIHASQAALNAVPMYIGGKKVVYYETEGDHSLQCPRPS